MLLTRARIVPQWIRARLFSLFGFTSTLPSCTRAVTSPLIGSLSVPSLPLAVLVCPATSTVAPGGGVPGGLPLRDIPSPQNRRPWTPPPAVAPRATVSAHHPPRLRTATEPRRHP